MFNNGDQDSNENSTTACAAGNSNASKYNKESEAAYKGYLAAEFIYPILPDHKGGADWFYSLPKHDDLCHLTENIYGDYRDTVK